MPPSSHPLPPPDFPQVELPITEFRQSWFRLSGTLHPAIYWGLNPPRRDKGRFDAPNGEYGVLYLASDPRCAFIETFGHNTGIRSVEMTQLRARTLYRIGCDRPLRLADLTGPRLTQVGADSLLFSGDVAIAQQWSLAIYRHPKAAGGIHYHARHDPSRMSVALFNRGDMEQYLAVTSLGTLADRSNNRLLGEILKTYRFALL